MIDRYLVIVGNPGARSVAETTEHARLLGLEARASWAGARLLTSPAAPTAATPDGGIVIGHLFRRDGTRVQDGLLRLSTTDPARIRSHLVNEYWGEYLLIQGGHDGPLRLTVTRDPSGGLPCVYATDRGAGFITSDISMAMQLGLYRKQVDWIALAHFLTYPYVKTGRTALDSVGELLPGNTLWLDDAGSRVGQAWSPWRFVAPPYRHARFDSAATELRAVTQRTIASWAGVDESILVELSGGLDSSIVATCLRGVRADVSCVTLVSELPGADEREYARAVTEGLGVQLHTEGLTVAAASFDAPPPSSAVGPGAGPLQHAADAIMERVAGREGMRSFYSGGGGDTVFGYLGGAAPAADAFRECGLSAGMRAVRDLADLHQCTTWRAASLAARKLKGVSTAPPAAISDMMNRDAVVGAPDPHPWSDAPPGAFPGDRERVLGLAGTQLFRDGLSRATRRPLRLPLLSQPVMETCLSIPTWMWNTGGVDRSVARAAFAALLPRNVVERRSKGNFLQYNGAVYRQKKDHMRDYLMEGVLQSHHLLDREAIAEFFKRPSAPRDRAFMRVFDLCRAEAWARQQV
ncbi:asparagine synthase [Luteimonas viscosa]|uniref:asparagine synthase (glutamine-hydrolyzing) n=1 Tax=Luteimonas viscosa TaxID=1132694 RepID=A0A5D4XT57_9GAMM|nr:asparagine synthase C-terminal domain-containing protein [Luteimonas viscosa]TYT26172.1 asparagine synthase [Luteimonas viscosa]